MYRSEVPEKLPEDGNTTNNNMEDCNEIYWITGLDRVLYTKASCCAEDVHVAGIKPPRYLWYMVSGGVCDVLQICILYALHTVIADAAACWCLGFILSIPVRHISHRYLVFGDYVGGYWKSLARMYAGYSVIIVLSTIFSLVISRVLAVSLLVLSLVTMLWTGVANYFILRYFWSFGGSGGGVHATNSSTS
jgi:putative flippase GtrA